MGEKLTSQATTLREFVEEPSVPGRPFKENKRGEKSAKWRHENEHVRQGQMSKKGMFLHQVEWKCGSIFLLLRTNFNHF